MFRQSLCLLFCELLRNITWTPDDIIRHSNHKSCFNPDIQISASLADAGGNNILPQSQEKNILVTHTWEDVSNSGKTYWSKNKGLSPSVWYLIHDGGSAPFCWGRCSASWASELHLHLSGPGGPRPRNAKLLCISFPYLYVFHQDLMAPGLWPVLCLAWHFGLGSCQASWAAMERVCANQPWALVTL